jgi:uroporphyrin-III C-methyltransferase
MYNVTNTPADGFVWLVGAGPGAADLITVRGRNILEQAEVVVHDELAGEELLKFCPPGCEFHYVGKRAGKHCATQAEISTLMIEHASRGRRVVRLKGGDPSLFARLGEEMDALRNAGIPFEIIPGVTAACAAAAAAGVSLTHRAHASAAIFVTGHECATKCEAERVDWTSLARTGTTLCVYMGVRRLEYAAEQLLAGGLPATTPLTVVSNASRPTQRIFTGTLADACRLAASADGQPSLILIGEAVRGDLLPDSAFAERLAAEAVD